MTVKNEDLLNHLHAMEAAAVKRHAELLTRIDAAEDAASCAGLDVEVLHRYLARMLEDED